MKKEIVFLTDGNSVDAAAWCCLCYLAQKTKTTLTCVQIGKGYHDKFVAALMTSNNVTVVANLDVALEYLDDYELDQVNCQFASIPGLCSNLDIPDGVAFAACDLAVPSPFHLPSVMANILRHRLGMVEFGNFIAEKWITHGTRWNIVRDENVLELIDPKGAMV